MALLRRSCVLRKMRSCSIDGCNGAVNCALMYNTQKLVLCQLLFFVVEEVKNDDRFCGR